MITLVEKKLIRLYFFIVIFIYYESANAIALFFLFFLDYLHNKHTKYKNSVVFPENLIE